MLKSIEIVLFCLLFGLLCLVHGEAADQRTWWYDTGELQSFTLYRDDDVRHGASMHWFLSGQLQSISTYRDNVLNGPETVWFETGQLHIKHTFKDGKETGLSTSWWNNGRKRQEYIAVKGVMTKRHQWFSDGSPKDTPNPPKGKLITSGGAHGKVVTPKREGE